MAKQNWFQKGQEGKKRADQFDAEAKKRREQGGGWRFRQDYDSAAKVVFLDNPEFFLAEHNIQTGPKRWEQYTCIRDFDTCPLCESGNNPSYVVVATVINLKPYRDKAGKVHKMTKALFVGKGIARQNLLRQVERRDGDLSLCAFEIARGTQTTEPATGSDFDFIRRLTAAQAKKLIPEGKDESYLKPFDYTKILAPLSPAKLRSLVGASDPVGADSGDDDDDVPFDVGEDSEKGEPSEEPGDEGVDSIDDLL